MAARGATVLAVEKNRDACKWLAENVRLNRVEGRTKIINADVFQILQILKMDFDRAVIPTPYGMDSVLEAVSSRVKKGGMVHFYTFKKRQQIEGLVQSYSDMGFEVEAFRRCGNVAPGVSRWAFDLKKNDRLQPLSSGSYLLWYIDYILYLSLREIRVDVYFILISFTYHLFIHLAGEFR